jgi:hypothetical protein
MRWHVVIGLSTMAFLLTTAFVGGQTVTFEMIPGAASANDMSPDGRYIVGDADKDGNGFADGLYLLDTVTNVMTPLPDPGLSAVAVSDDGTVVLGDIPDPEGVGSNVAARWTEATGWQSLGHLPNAGACPSRSDGFELSADGSIAVGLSWDGCNGRGFWWSEATGMLELEPLANGSNRASVVSADGSLIGGFAQGSFSRTPAIWDDTLAGELLDPPNGDAIGEVHGMNDAGTILLGSWATVEPAVRAVKWTASESGWVREQIADGSLMPGWGGTPMDIAYDGTIVGFDILLGNRRAWIQPDGTGQIVNLKTWVEDHGGTVPTGLILEVPQAISTDGRYIVGHGFLTGAWRITVTLDCDFDGDGVCGIEDIDALVMNIAAMTNDPEFDLTGDGLVDLADRDEWLAEAGAANLPSGNPYLVADSNLDGTVDGQDFIAWNANKFSATAKWSLADFNGDGTTDGQDFVEWNANKFLSADGQTPSVPEPSALALLLVGGWALALRRRLRRRQRPGSMRQW